MYKTKLGLFFTFLNLCFVLFTAIYFGLDIIYHSKPITRTSNIYQDNAEIFIKDFPIMVEFFELTGKKIDDFEKYITLGGSYFEIWMDNDNEYYRVHWEPCSMDKHFSKYKDFIVKSNLTLSDYYCLDPYKLLFKDFYLSMIKGHSKKILLLKMNMVQ